MDYSLRMVTFDFVIVIQVAGFQDLMELLCFVGKHVREINFGMECHAHWRVTNSFSDYYLLAGFFDDVDEDTSRVW